MTSSSDDDGPGGVDAGEEADAGTACEGPAECTDPGAPVCAADGVCVGCEAASDCSGTTPLCGEDRVCHGCSKDAECAGGLCVEATGACVLDEAVSFVAQAGNDSGLCTRQAPCATFTYAYENRGERATVKVLGGSFAGVASMDINSSLVLDGSDTQLNISGTSIVVYGGDDVIIEGFKLVAPPSAEPPAAGIDVNGLVANTRVRLHDVAIDGDGSLLLQSRGLSEVAISSSRIGRLASNQTNSLVCRDGKMLLETSVIEKTRVSQINSCELTVRRNRFESDNDGSVSAEDGQLVMENNLIVHSDGYNDSIYAIGLRPGSTIRFNTIVNTTPVPLDGSALYCDASVQVSSNIFAYESGHPITGTGCAPRYSIFDTFSTTSAGTGNEISNDLFVDRANGDYRLSATSPARGGAEPGLGMVSEDLEGNPRPAGGTVADCGAFEAE